MIQIRKEVDDIISAKQPKDSNLLKNAPHPVALMTLPENEWNRPYTKDQAAYPLPNLRKNKFWPTVTRIDDGMSPCPRSSRFCLPCCRSVRRHPSHLLMRFRRGLRRHRRRGTQDLGRRRIQHVATAVPRTLFNSSFSVRFIIHSFCTHPVRSTDPHHDDQAQRRRPCASTAVVIIIHRKARKCRHLYLVM